MAQKDNLKAMIVMGHGGNTVTRMPNAAKAIEKLDLLVVADPHPTTWAALSERKNGTYLLPVATSYETNGSRTSSNRAIQWGEQIVKPIFEFEGRPRDHVSAGQEARLRRQDVQEHQGRRQSAGGRGRAARDQPRRLVDRLLRPVAGAPEVAYGPSGRLRHAHAEGHDRAEQGRLLRPAVAVLGHAGVQASRHAAALQHQSFDQGRRRHVPRPLRRRARGKAAGRHHPQGEPARQRLLLQGFRDQGRLSGVHATACSRSSAGTRT